MHLLGISVPKAPHIYTAPFFMKRLLRNNFSIKNKLLLFILTISVVLLILVSGALLYSEQAHLKNNMSNDLNTLAEIMGINSSVGLSFQDDLAVRDVLKSLRVKPYIMMAQVFTADGSLFADYYRADVPPEKAQHIKDFDQTNSVEMLPDGHIQVTEGFHFQDEHGHAYTFRNIIHDNLLLGVIFIQADLTEFKQRMLAYAQIMGMVMLASLALAMLLARTLQSVITEPVYHLRDTIHDVTEHEDYTRRAEKHSNDELGELIDGFNTMLFGIEKRDREIISLNDRLKEENQRMGAELEVTRQIQQMVLPKAEELNCIQGLDIAGYMSPADEVGGDYYDVLCHGERVKIGIGDVTGHGLESGVVMLMVQTAVRTLLENEVRDLALFLDVINRTIFANVQRMSSDKNLTLSLLDYKDGKLKFTGQHEYILVVRKGGKVEVIDTEEYGFMIGMVADIKDFVAVADIQLEVGDSVVLYTDGITEAFNMDKKMYGLERLCQSIAKNWRQSADNIQRAAIEDVQHFAGEKKFMDDITLLVIKRVS